ncbi:hypothetical protein QR680_014577 [Steinernema hermaphroditum]|uniref:Phospholipase B-like n=1 Tax=Steinernema hermaphroditum TaxID=289476 RepID=A0AA39I9D1_9BILA|nr:hypothetical protein QR680_014577 [Steinernema hermaphroditum]
MMLLKVALFAFVLSTAHGSGSPKTVLAKIRTGVKWYTKIASRLDHIAPPDDVLINLASAVYELSSLDVSEAIDNELEQFGKVNDRIDEEINEGTNLLKSYLLQMELKHGLYEKKWWTKGIVPEGEKFLSEELSLASKQQAAAGLREHFREKYGTSRWPDREIFRFGVLVINDKSFYMPTGYDGVFLAHVGWENHSSDVLIYKSSFDGDATVNYRKNQDFYHKNIQQIKQIFQNVTFSKTCMEYGLDHNKVVSDGMEKAVMKARKFNEQLFFFWRSAIERSDFEDIGLAIDKDGQEPTGALFEIEVSWPRCYLMYLVKIPFQIFVGF